MGQHVGRTGCPMSSWFEAAQNNFGRDVKPAVFLSAAGDFVGDCREL